MIDPKLDSQRPLTGPAPQANQKEADEQAISEAISGKLSSWGTHGSRAAGSAVRNMDAEDRLLMSADALRAAGDVIKDRTGSSRLGAIAEITVAATHLTRGNLYRAGYHIGKAIEALGKAASASRVGAAANAVVLLVSPEQLKAAHQRLREDAEATVAESASREERAKSFFDLSRATWQVAYLYRVVSKAAVTVVKFGVNTLARSVRFTAAGLKLQAGMGRIAAGPLGRVFGGFTKWVPLLNVAGVAMSAKNAIDVYHDAHASLRTQVLAVGSVMLAGAGLWAAISLGLWPFLGLTAVGIGIDLALLRERSRDRAKAIAQIPATAAPSSEPDQKAAEQG